MWWQFQNISCHIYMEYIKVSRLSLYIDSGRGIVPLSQQIKIDMTNWLQWKISPKQRRALKNVLSRVGMKFATKR